MSLTERLQQLAQTIGTDIKSIYTSLYALLGRIEIVESRLETSLRTPSGPVLHPKMFSTVVEASDGKWTVDYSSAEFNSILSVHATAEDVGTSAGNRRIACISQDSITPTGCSGRFMSADSAGLLAAMTLVSGGSGRVHILVIGS